MAVGEFKYRAFISYSHADENWGKWLHLKLERYRVPSRLVGKEGVHGPVPRRIGRCFRDQAELTAASDLGETLQQALRESQVLIVVCSPRSAQSKWVNEEIQFFRSLGRGRDIYALIVDGHPHAAEPSLECFPAALRSGADGLQFHPLAADARSEKDGKVDAFLKLVAGIIGVRFDELRRRELRRRYRLFAILVGVSLVIAAGTSVLAIFAVRARNEARFQQAHAEHAKDFLLSVFHEEDPTLHTTKKQRTPLQLVTEAAKRLDVELVRDPTLHAELTEELGEIRRNLGDSDGARDMLTSALAERKTLFGDDSMEVARSYIELGKLEDTKKGDQSPEVAGNARSALARLQRLGRTETVEQADAERLLARNVGSSEKGANEALGLLEHAQTLYERLLGTDDPRSIDAMLARASVLTDAARYADAQHLAAQAIERVERSAGSDSIRLSYPLRLRAYLLSQQGANTDAASDYQRAATIEKTELGDRNAVLSDTLARLGSALYAANQYPQGRKAFADAERALPDGDDYALQDVLDQKVQADLEAQDWQAMVDDAHRDFLLLRKLYGDGSTLAWSGAAANEGRALAELGDFKRSKAVLEDAVSKTRDIAGPDAFDNWSPLTQLGDLYLHLSAYTDAVGAFRAALKIAESHLAKESLQHAQSASNLAIALGKLGDQAADNEAQSLLNDAIATHRKLQSDMPLADALTARGSLLLRKGRRDEGRKDLKEALQLYQHNGGNYRKEIAELEKSLR